MSYVEHVASFTSALVFLRPLVQLTISQNYLSIKVHQKLGK